MRRLTKQLAAALVVLAFGSALLLGYLSLG